MPDDWPSDDELAGEPWIREIGRLNGMTFRCEHMEVIGVQSLTCPQCGPLTPSPSGPEETP